MQISIDNQVILELSEIQKQVIKNDIPEEIFEEDIARRLRWLLLDEKYQRCLKRLKEEWVPKLANRYDSIPTNDEMLAELIFSQSDYKNRSEKIADEAVERAALAESAAIKSQNERPS